MDSSDTEMGVRPTTSPTTTAGVCEPTMYCTQSAYMYMSMCESIVDYRSTVHIYYRYIWIRPTVHI